MAIQRSLEEAATTAIVDYRVSLRSAEDLEDELQKALTSASCLDKDELYRLQVAYAASLSRGHVSREILRILIDELGYVPSVPDASNFN